MTTRDRLTLAAALAVALASSALRPLYEDLGWLLPVLGAVVAVSGAAALARLASAPRGLQPCVAVLALLAYTALTFAGSTLAYGLLPTLETVTSLATTFRNGMGEVEVLAPPVPTTPELVLLAVLGAGAVMVAVDTLAVVLRKVAVSGLPLLVLFAVPAGVLPGGIGLAAFILGAAGWLGLLLADGSDRVSRWGTPLRSAHAPAGDPSLGRVGRRIGAAALGVAAVVPVLVPGLDGRLLGNGTGDGLGGSRSTTTYNPLLSLAGQLRQGTTQTLLTYDTTKGADYLRLTTLDLFDPDSGWSSSQLSAQLDEDGVQDGVPAPLGRSAPSETVDVTIDLSQRLGGPWLPVPAVPSDIEIDGPWLWDAEAETVFSTRTSVRDVDEPYTVRTRRVQPDVSLLRQPQSVPARIAETYSVDPELSEEARAVLEEVTAGARTDFDRVAALQTFFRDTDFEYSETTGVPPTNSPDALTAFLEERRGFCEQFASAMAALVRGLDIPARVAVGFITGSRDDDGSYRVTTREAHAWPEVWFSDVGWVRFEPTPRSNDVDVDVPEYSVAPPQAESPTTTTAAPSAAPAVPQAGPSAAPGAVDRAGEDGQLAADGSELDQGPSAWWLLVPAVLPLLGVPSLLAAVRRRRRWHSPAALAGWASVTDDAVDVGHRWRPADSPRAAAAHLVGVRHLPDDAAEALARLAAGAERARYARTAPPADTTALRADASTVRAALLAGATPRERWLARLLPFSTVRSTSTRLGTAAADVLDRFDAIISAVGARLRHPRARVSRAS
jgi:transglutaminase-like putative cysteine protease